MRFYCTDTPSVTQWPDGKGVEESKTEKQQYEVMNDMAATLGSTQGDLSRCVCWTYCTTLI